MVIVSVTTSQATMGMGVSRGGDIPTTGVLVDISANRYIQCTFSGASERLYPAQKGCRKISHFCSGVQVAIAIYIEFSEKDSCILCRLQHMRIIDGGDHHVLNFLQFQFVVTIFVVKINQKPSAFMIVAGALCV
jgi:hypothetical protein